jgi:hypothetical protein
MRTFLSHVSEEAIEAQALKKVLEAAIPGSEVFVSASDIHLGEAWLREIDEALAGAKVILALCSPNSVRRPWLNFESGSGWSRRLKVVPICHKGMVQDQLPDPLGIFQAVELKDAGSCRRLVEQLAAALGGSVAEGFDPAEMLRALRVESPARSNEVGIVLCHRQGEWQKGGRSVFSLPESLPEEIRNEWSFRQILEERELLSPNLHKLSGLILANPWRARMRPETIAAFVDWVRSGGRLLLLGFELGDRHHDGNLAVLSHHFGIDPAGDIVGPAGQGSGKPYRKPVDFNPAEADEHPFTSGLTTIRLVNVQTVRVDPGGVEWLRVGSNVVYRPQRDIVSYHDGTLTTPGGSAFEINESASWLPVAVEAPGGLCGEGGVHMIGTWDILGRNQELGDDNPELLTRLFDWLSRKAAGR